MTHSFEGFEVALARFVEHLAPLVAIGHIKIFVQTDGRSLGGTIDAVRQLITFGHFLPTGLEDPGAGKERVKQVFQLFLGVALATLHGALGITALFGNRCTLLAQG